MEQEETEELPEIDLTVAVEDARWLEVLPELETVCVEVVELVLSDLENVPPAPTEVACVFVGDAAIRDLNVQYRQKDKPTNVLSFAADDMILPGMPAVLGDIFLSYETICREAAEQGKQVRAHATHMLVHGLLHLLGYDHETEEDAEEMESREIELLSEMGIANPYHAMRSAPHGETVH